MTFLTLASISRSRSTAKHSRQTDGAVIKKSILYDEEFYRERHQRTKHAAHAVLQRLISDLQINSVVDFGCGVGTWLYAAKLLGAAQVRGFEGTWLDNSKLVIDPWEFEICALENPVIVDRRYDLAISLEVAEHLPPTRAKSFVADLCRVSDIVLFSAAVPHQGGVGHINEQCQSYWAELFREQGYRPIDCIRRHIWADPDIDFWYKQNILLYVAEHKYVHIWRTLALSESKPDGQIDLIHPQLYLDHIRRLQSLRALLPLCWKIFLDRVRRRLRRRT